MTNNIDLNNAQRFIQLTDNPDVDTDVAEISGVISTSTGTDDNLTIRGQADFPVAGLLVLSGHNTFHTLQIGENTVQAVDSVGLPSTANLVLRASTTSSLPAVFATSNAANGHAFNRNIGAGAGEVQWGANGAGGFAAVGGDLTVTLEGGADLTWADPDTGFNGASSIVQLGSNVATGVTTFTNNVSASNTVEYFETFDNPLSNADRVVISGNYTGASNFRVDGDGVVELNGNISMSNNLVLVDNPFDGVLNAQINGTMLVGNNMSLDISGARAFVNGTASVDNLLQDRVGNTLGGSGTIKMIDDEDTGGGSQQAQIQGTLNPGSDFDKVGKLTFDLTASPNDPSAGEVRFQNGSFYEMEFENDGGVKHDTTDIKCTNQIGLIQLGLATDETWNLVLDALDDMTGLVSGSDEFDLLTWDGNNDFAINGTVEGASTSGLVDNVVLSSTGGFDVNSATVHFEVAGDFSGRVYVTGLAAASGAGALAGGQVPEPAGCMLAVVAAVAVLVGSRRYGRLLEA